MRLAPASLAAVVSALLPAAALAVNLVPNPSFETYAPCPPGFGQLLVAAPWDTPNTGTSDYFNACAPVVFPSLNVPQNQLGFEPAQNGVGYAGLIPYSAAPDYREYLSAPLTSPMTAGTPYTVEFYVSLADSAMTAVDRIGAYFSVGPVGPVPNYAALPYTPQVESPANVPLNNSNGWTLISGVYVATGGESYITIGSFRDDASTSTSPGPGTWPGGSYYYVDAIGVEVATPAEEACCLPDGTCSMQFPGECSLLGGTSAGPGTQCLPVSPCEATDANSASWGQLKIRYR